MRISSLLPRDKDAALRLAVAIIITLGIVMRLAMYLHNRNLIIDEANIVRNLAERGFGGLVRPLSYEQYAPPVFLWIEKLASLVAGYGEMAMRFYALVCGVVVLFLFRSIAPRFMSRRAMLLPLCYLATGFIFLKYASEVKQYMPDTAIALFLIWLALRLDIHTLKMRRFVLCWVSVGSIAIWSSMPAVFILAGIGAYYAWQLWSKRAWRTFLPLLFITGVWLAQFALYYFAVLQSQINSSYLQGYHHDYFLTAFPANYEEWKHDWKRLEDIMGNVGGWSGVAVVSNLLFVIAGCVSLLRRRCAIAMLAVVPVALVLLAAALRQFSLIDRVVLFMMPLWLLLIGAGFQAIWELKKLPVKILLLLIAGYNAFAYMAIGAIVKPYEFHEITKGMEWIEARGGKGTNLYVHAANVPTYIYYTELHPQKARWAPLLGARRLEWNEDYSQVTKNARDTVYFLYTGGFSEEERNNRIAQIEQNMRQVNYFQHAVCFVYVYVPK